MADLAELEVWAFERWRKDHLALVDADTTLCGRSKNPHGFPTLSTFDPTANYDCKRCLASLRKLGVARVFYRRDNYEPRSEVIITASEPWSEAPRGGAVKAEPDKPEQDVGGVTDER